MPNSTADRVPDKVRQLMKDKGISQAVLGAQVGLGQKAISRRLLGTVPFTLDELVQFAAALDVPLAELIATS